MCNDPVSAMRHLRRESRHRKSLCLLQRRRLRVWSLGCRGGGGESTDISLSMVVGVIADVCFIPLFLLHVKALLTTVFGWGASAGQEFLNFGESSRFTLYTLMNISIFSSPNHMYISDSD